MSLISFETAPTEVSNWLTTALHTVDDELDRRLALPPDLPADDPVMTLSQAMRYAVLKGGKRLRPALVLAAAQACGGTQSDALPAAAAIEILHAYTLVHDDLPAMDDDRERRGRPTVHVQYDEATAILVGDALLTRAFGCLADLPSGIGDAVSVLATRGGTLELLGGQMLDIAWQDSNHTPNPDELSRLHRGKTGALFAAACELGAIASGANEATRKIMASYGLAVGVAFQHADDLDDGDFPEHTGHSRSERKRLGHVAQDVLSGLGPKGDLLRSFARWIAGD